MSVIFVGYVFCIVSVIFVGCNCVNFATKVVREYLFIKFTMGRYKIVVAVSKGDFHFFMIKTDNNM